MRIFCLCLVKNEEDIIADVLKAACSWSHKIFVLDNGSSDNTWQIVCSLASQSSIIVPHGVANMPFSDELREILFSYYFDQAEEGDWWCILDSDEFFVDEPRKFLSSVDSQSQSVFKQDIKFRFTVEDLDRFSRGDFKNESEFYKSLRHYKSDYAEMRFFRHTPMGDRRIPWLGECAYSSLIRVRHYPNRFPAQIEKRLLARAETAEAGLAFGHELKSHSPDGRRTVGKLADRLERAVDLFCDTGDGEYEWVGPPLKSYRSRHRIRGFVHALGTSLRRLGSALERRA